MRKLNANQFKVLADFSNYIAVAWFTGGVITPILNKEGLFQTAKIIGLGAIMTAVFLFSSLMISKEARL